MEMERDRWAAEAAEGDRVAVADKAGAEWAGRLPPDRTEAVFARRAARSRLIFQASPVINNNALSVGR